MNNDVSQRSPTNGKGRRRGNPGGVSDFGVFVPLETREESASSSAGRSTSADASLDTVFKDRRSGQDRRDTVSGRRKGDARKSVADTLSVAADTLGAQLQVAREAYGLSLEELSWATHISLFQLRALEANEFQKLPPHVILRGYLRILGRQLDLDGEQLLQRYDEESGANQAAVDVNSKEPEKLTAPVLVHRLGELFLEMFKGYAWHPALITVAPIALVVLIAWSLQGDNTDAPATQFVLDTAEGVSPLAPLAAVAVTSDVRNNAEESGVVGILPPEEQRQLASEAGTESTPAVVASPPQRTQFVERQEVAAAATEVQALVELASRTPVRASAAAMVAQHVPSDRLVIAVHEDSWVDIRDRNGTRLYRNLARAGNKIDVSGSLPFALHVGNAPGLELELNGAPFVIAEYRTDNSARLTIAMQ